MAFVGEWHLEQGRWAPAVKSLHEAVRMARASWKERCRRRKPSLSLLGSTSVNSPILVPKPSNSVLREWHSYLNLANLWLAIGDHEQAKKYALTAYKWVWNDGEPYVYRY